MEQRENQEGQGFGMKKKKKFLSLCKTKCSHKCSYFLSHSTSSLGIKKNYCFVISSKTKMQEKKRKKATCTKIIIIALFGKIVEKIETA